jgi:nitrate reductase gamma subunit
VRALGGQVAPVVGASVVGAGVVAVGATTLPSVAALGLAGVVGLVLLAVRRRELLADWQRLRSLTA